MKKATITGVLFLITFTTIIFGNSAVKAQPGVSISFQTFHDELAPYGRWAYDDDDGRIWIPDVERDFRPYATRGHWIVTDYGNTWVSDYDWGWAPFHYGRWRMHDRYGWVWIPGDEWGPAWVSWRSGGGYYGWSPMGPRVGISININLPNLWVFVPERQLCSPYVYNYYERSPRVVNIYHNTTIINNIYRNNNHNYVYGPDRRDIERATHSRVDVYKVNDSGRPGNATVRNGSVNIYRPEVNRDQRWGSRNDDNRDNRNSRNDDRNNNNDRDNRSRPGYSDSGNATSSERVMPENSRAGNSAPVRPQVDRTPAVEQRAPYEDRYSQRSQGSDRDQSAQQRNEERRAAPARGETPQNSERWGGQSSSREMPQRSEERRVEQSSRRDAPQQQSSGRTSGPERTQSKTEQSSEKQNDSRSERERPSRVR
jgi:hypothetical protein